MATSIDTLINNAQKYAGDVTKDARDALKDASSMVRTVGFLIPNVPQANLPEAPKVVEPGVFPVFTPVDLTLPPEPPPMLAFQDLSPLESANFPVFDLQAPAFNAPNLPTPIGAFTGSTPSINTSFSFPQPPGLLTNPNFGELPTMGSYQTPSKPNITLPVFDGVMPTDNTQAPTDLEGRFRSAYQGASSSMVSMMDGYVDGFIAKNNPEFKPQMARIEAQLKKYLDGGTGLNAAAENAIYERARGKNDAEARRTQAAAYADAANRGFTLPPGALMAAMGNARQASADNNARAAGEIVAMQAEMEQKNLQFAVTTSAGLRQAMLSAALSYHGNCITINGQALTFAQGVLGAIVEMYNTAVKLYGMKLDAYKVQASVYETLLRGALAGIEVYKAEIQAMEALISVDKAKLDVYRARIDSLQSLAAVYRSQVDAVVSQAGLEKLKLEIFQSQVQAYGAQVQAKDSEYRGHSAAIEGQNALSRNFAVQAEAYKIQMEGFKVNQDAKIEVLKATAITNQARASQYAATLNGYSEVVKARGDVARTRIENQRQSIVAYQVQSQASIANAQAYAEHYKATSSVQIENARLTLTGMTQEANSRREFGQTIASLGNASASVYQGLASSAMSGMSTLAAQLTNS